MKRGKKKAWFYSMPFLIIVGLMIVVPLLYTCLLYTSTDTFSSSTNSLRYNDCGNYNCHCDNNFSNQILIFFHFDYLHLQVSIFSILKTGSCQSFLFFSIALIVQAKPVIIESSIAPPIASFIPAPKKKPTNAAITIRMIEMITLIIYTSINKNLRFSLIFKISFNLFIYNNSYRYQNQ